MKLLLFCTVVLSAAPLAAQTATPLPQPNWHTAGSDIPADPRWRFGTLPNGLRYAVGRSTQPPGAIAIRVRIGVGALMESDRQLGWTHLIEHMAFRGSAHYADGEGIRLWQRLGASFGSDTNASTTRTATTYQLDLPRADAASYGEAMAVLADMMDAARFDAGLLATERTVVLAERSARYSPLATRIRDAQLPLFLAGTTAAKRDVIGTPATLGAATAPALRGYYETWYRPDNAVIVVAGNADPAAMEAGIVRAFGGWQPSGPRPAPPELGLPASPSPGAAVVVDPQAPSSWSIGWVTPHRDGPQTLARAQGDLLDYVAVAVLNRRLATAAQRGRAITNAGLSLSRQRQMQDQLTLGVTPRPGQWREALNEAWAVLNGATAAPPSPAEIDRQAAAITSGLRQQVASSGTRTAPALANTIVSTVEAGDVAAAPEFWAGVFDRQRSSLTPVAVAGAIRRLLAPTPRMLLLSSTPVAGGTATVVAALASARTVAGGREATIRAVSLDQLVLHGKPASVVGTEPIVPLGAERIRFSNGVELVLKRTAFEKDRVQVRVEVGHGLIGLPRDQQAPWWSYSALLAAGLGPFDADELGRVLAGRQIGFGISPGETALVLSGAANAADTPDLLRLIAGEMTQPRFEAIALDRVRESFSTGYRSLFSQPGSVMGAFGGPALHGGDRRFLALPSLDTIQRITLPEVRQFWTEQLATGPVRVIAVGDFDRDAIVAAVARTLGTLPARPATPLPPALSDVRATPPATSVVLRHGGDPAQALVLRVFPTLGALDDVPTGTALDLLAAIVETRLTEGFRSTEGGSYAPDASHPQSFAMPHYGALIAGAQVGTARVDAFGRTLDAVLADLAANGPSADAFGRARTTAIAQAERSRSNNGWWLGVLSGETTPAEATATAGQIDQLKRLTPAAVQAAARRYLGPGKGVHGAGAAGKSGQRRPDTLSLCCGAATNTVPKG